MEAFLASVAGGLTQIYYATALYGTTDSGGTVSPSCPSSGCGVVYELTPPPAFGDPWSQTVIYSFKGGADGDQPSTLLLGDGGTLYGVTAGGRVCPNSLAQGCGTLFQLTPPATPGNPWTKTILHAFKGGGDGWTPYGLALDQSGVLYGTTLNGGDSGFGTVYQLTRGAGTLPAAASQAARAR